MDKIVHSIFGRLRVRNMTIAQALIFFTFITLITAVVILAFEFAVFDQLQKNIMAPYLKEYTIAPDVYANIVSTEPTAADAYVIENISNWQMIAVCLTVIGLVIGEALMFYRIKLKKPLAVLSQASEKIIGNELDFQVFYDSRDEMGKLCSSFEKMRASLEENNRRMWRSIEERKQLNAAFSHDLRTPLTVLRGYSDILTKYLPSDKLSKEKIISTVSTMSGHIYRLENYVTGMNALQKLEDISIHTQPADMDIFLLRMKESAAILSQGKGIEVSFSAYLPGDKMDLDIEIVMQVFENLISNAVRFAREKIQVRCDMKDDIFRIIVSDDGPGFTMEDLQKASGPFYKGKGSSDETHFGLGLHICKVLCERHGGTLKLDNNPGGGAAVTAGFASGRKNN